MSKALILLSCVIAFAAAADYTWDSCGTRLDRLKTTDLKASGSFAAGGKVTVTASGNTDLHAPLESGAWQVRIYEDGVAKSTSTAVGDLMTALKFDDPKNTTFTMTVEFPLPAKQASGKFDANLVATDQAKSDYLCLDVKYSYAAVSMVEDVQDETCFHDIDAEDHKCFEACASAKFVTKGITDSGPCPGSYNVVDTTQVVDQCPDGVTNLRYCSGSDVNVTIKRKGEAGSTQVTLEAPVQDASVYCMNDPSKHAPFYCHVPPLPTSCTKDSDCVTPWYNSWCMNDPSKSAPYVCKIELPPTCTTDADCQKS